jgi:energy-coupling factor transporter ATP-binding protein EcfA2
MVGSLFPRGPFPLLCINGEQGSGKSTACRIIKELIDPAVSNLYSMPGNSHDVMVAAANNWVLAYENLSGIPPWLSDCLCVLSTGGGYSARALYTDEQEQVIAVQRPVLLNGITDLMTRPDLQSRAVAVTLEPISAYRTESEIREAIRKAVPYALGALLDAASAALDGCVSAPVDPGARMADFARRAAAAAPALGWRAQDFLSRYSENRRKVEEELLDSSPVATALRAFAEAHPGGWTGTMTELWEALTPEPRPREWPGNARGLSAQIRRYAPVLRRGGIQVSHETAHGRKRLVTITCGGANDPGFAPPV